ncbi:MAG: dihydroorotase [Bacillota bacterium]|nr:dihydroorotase [Bacillota bacterium]
MELLLRGGRVVDPEQGLDGRLDVRIADGRVAEVGEDLLPGPGAEVRDVAGMVVLPGLIDPHVHLREPGREDAETVRTGTRAAARGGFTAVAAMPNTRPAIDRESLVRFVLDRAAREGAVRVYAIGAVTKERAGEELAEMGDMARAGAVAFSDDGSAVMNAALFRRALEYARGHGRPVIVHAEDRNLVGDGVMNEGALSTRLGLPGVPAAAEEVMVARDLLLAELTGARLHVAHVSTAGALRLIREAKARGVRVTCEVTPHHLFLTEEAVWGYDTNARVSPPLRTEADCAALQEGLVEGTIDAVATDHAPHTREEKLVEFGLAAPGMVGLETAVALVVDRLVRTGRLSWAGLAERLSYGPARVLGLPLNAIAPGAPADLTVVDPGAEWTVDPDEFASKSRNTPFAGWRLKGRPAATIVAGRLLMWQGELLV